MRILISGSTGLVGSAAVEVMRRQGHEVSRLVRPGTGQRRVESSAEQRQVAWDPIAGILDSDAEGADAVIHLAGASIAGGRWTTGRKRILRDSRVAATRHLVSALGKLRRPPQVFVAASAIGYYGNRGDEELTESSPGGTDFLAQLTRDWEAESARAAQFGARVAVLRFGIILAKQGGALPRIALPFRLGLGGPIGSGRQWMSWIALQDVVGVILYALGTNLFGGIANVVSPHPVRNSEFARELGSILHRPAIFSTPGFALRLALGEMAEALLLGSERVLPEKLEQLDYRFLQPELRAALSAIFSR